MELSDLTSLLEISAALNIAFVAVEVANGYTSILLNRVFNFNSIIEGDFGELEDSIRLNQNSLEHIEPTDIKEGNTNQLIEDTKRNYEKILSEVSDEKESLLNWAQSNCEFKCFSGLSLVMFLYCCYQLFLAACGYNYAIGISSVLTLLYCLSSYFFNKYTFCTNLKWSIGMFAMIMISSIPFIWVGQNWTTPILTRLEPFIVLFAVLLPFINFVVFYFLIMYKVNKMKETVHDRMMKVKEKIKPINEQFNQLQSLDQLKVSILSKNATK